MHMTDERLARPRRRREDGGALGQHRSGTSSPIRAKCRETGLTALQVRFRVNALERVGGMESVDATGGVPGATERAAVEIPLLRSRRRANLEGPAEAVADFEREGANTVFGRERRRGAGNKTVLAAEPAWRAARFVRER